MTMSYNSYGTGEAFTWRNLRISASMNILTFDASPVETSLSAGTDVRRSTNKHEGALSGTTWRIASSNHTTPSFAHLCSNYALDTYVSLPAIFVYTVCLYLFKSSHCLSFHHLHAVLCLCISKSSPSLVSCPALSIVPTHKALFSSPALVTLPNAKTLIDIPEALGKCAKHMSVLVEKMWIVSTRPVRFFHFRFRSPSISPCTVRFCRLNSSSTIASRDVWHAAGALIPHVFLSTMSS